MMAKGYLNICYFLGNAINAVSSITGQEKLGANPCRATTVHLN